MESCKKGERVILKDRLSQTFCGFIKSVNKNLGRIVLKDIILLPSQKPILGYRNFDRPEILELRKCEVSSIHSEDAADEDISVTPIIKLSESECEKLKTLQNGFYYIRSFDANFHCAVSLLKDCTKIGVFGKDVSNGRFERMSIMAISTPTNVLLFDVQLLGDEALHKGLKEILESPIITKIVYDCRSLSDCLKHKHSISLENVRDIEAEDIMVVYQDRRIIRRHSRSLEYLSQVYLGLELTECVESREAWWERPLPRHLFEALVSRASVLIKLQEEIERKYLEKLIHASNIYNNHLRNLDFFDVLNDEPKKTLRNKIGKLLAPQTQIRADFKLKKH